MEGMLVGEVRESEVNSTPDTAPLADSAADGVQDSPLTTKERQRPELAGQEML